MPSDNRPRCFIVEPLHTPLPGMHSLNEFGTPTYLFCTGELSHTDPGEQLADKIAGMLEVWKYNPHLDYLVGAGSMVTVLQMAAVAINLVGTNVKTLQYSKTHQKFYPVELG